LLIRFGDPPAPVPEPFAGLLRELAAAARSADPGWLFPGKYAGQSLAYPTAAKRLRKLGIPCSASCSPAVAQYVGAHLHLDPSGLRQPAQQPPDGAAVEAGAGLGDDQRPRRPGSRAVAGGHG
jgi:hypothetical protein